MKCPRCKCNDVYASQRGGESQGLLALVTTAVRCHRCCYLFSVPKWSYVPTKPANNEDRRAA